MTNGYLGSEINKIIANVEQGKKKGKLDQYLTDVHAFHSLHLLT